MTNRWTRALLADPYVQLAEVHLGLLTGARLIADGRQRSPARLGSPGIDRPPHLLDPTGEAESLELAMQHHRVPAYCWATLCQLLQLRSHTAWPCPPLARVPLP